MVTYFLSELLLSELLLSELLLSDYSNIES
jgi:hypothetical protein